LPANCDKHNVSTALQFQFFIMQAVSYCNCQNKVQKHTISQIESAYHGSS